MQKRFLLFIVLFFVTISGYTLLIRYLYPPPPVPVAQAPLPGVAEKAKGGPEKGAAAEQGKPPADVQGPKVPAAAKADAAPKPVAPANLAPAEYYTLGSLAPKDGTRMLATITNRGAAVVRLELNSPRYRAQEDRQLQDRGGYLGHLSPADDSASGARVQVVGPGTPAADARLEPGDVITAIDQQRVRHAADLEPAVAHFAPGDKVSLEVKRGGTTLKVPATLARRPLQMIRPEWETEPVEVLAPGKHDPLSLLLMLSKVGKHELQADEEQEIGGADLKDQNWQLAPNRTPDSLELWCLLPQHKLKVIKRYRIAKVPQAEINDDAYRAYHLMLDVVVERDAETPLEVAYRLDGPNGLPTEGWWYLNKIARNWLEGAGARDVALHFAGSSPELMGGPVIIGAAAKNKLGPWALKQTPSEDQSPLRSLAYIGVDTQYFSAILIPQKPLGETWYSRIEPRLVLGPDCRIGEIVGPAGNKLKITVAGEEQTYDINNDTRIVVDGADLRLGDLRAGQQAVVTFEKQQNTLVAKSIVVPRTRLANVSCRLTSESVAVTRGHPLTHSYELFAGPKERQLLSQYGPPKALDEINLSELIYYGWPIWGWFAKPLAYVLHFFAGLGNYGLAIVLLTVSVRLCMFPLSRKQALGAQKMQALQPEMKRISELYKKDLEKRSRAWQELQKKHNYNPWSGCLPMFIQLPIFIGLYRALMTDINLRQAPLITESLGWCTNLAAPDMLWRWEPYLPAFITAPTGNMFLFLPALGPYLNILPLVTVALYIWQQKLFMPPPADEQAAMQQKMMKYMMILMGFMFFRVPSGLCIYFIATSLWGIGERKLLPKITVPVGPGAPPARPVEKPPASNGSPDSPAKRRRKQRGKN